MDDKKYVSNVGPTVEILPASKITRPKCLLTREKLRLFLKCHSSQKSRGDTWNLKEESINKFALDRIRWEDIFKGPTPNFNDDTTILKQFSKRLSEGYQNVEPKSFSIDESDKTEEDGHCLSIQVVKKKSNLISTQKQKLSNKKEKIQKIVNNERTDKKKKRKLTKKQKLKEKVKGKKLKLKGQMRKSSTQEPSSNPSEKPAIDKIEEKRRIKESRRRFEEDLRLWSEKREDLLCDDLKPLPTPIPIECDIEERHFGDSILILEFICVFQDYINDFHNWFPSGISLELFSQILNETSINGPFGDLLRTLLGTILMSHVDYDPDNGSELKVEIKTGDDFDSYTNINEDDELNNFCDNNYSNNWVSTYFGTQEQLLKLRLDEFTLSEILRLYLLKARLDGNSKQLRRNEDDDMTLAIRLTSCTVYEFNQLERVQLFKLLLNDLVKVPQIRQKIEISMDEMFRLKTQIRHINAAHTKWLRDNPIRQRIRKRKVTVDEIANKDDVTDQTENEASQLEKDQYKKEKLQKEHQMKKSISELKGKIRQLSAFCRPRPLGMDRAYRRYWIFQSVPGLFVEHSFDEIQTRPCLESPTPTPKPQFNDYLPNAKRRKRKSKVVEENDVSVKMDDVAQPADLNSTELSKDIFDKCTGTLTTCSVHGLANSEKRVLWSFYTKDQLDNFIESLSNRGFRENELKTALTFEKLSIEKDHLSGLIPTVLNRNYLPPLIFDEFVGSDDDGTGLKRKSERIQNQNLEKATQATKLQDQTARHMRSDSKYSAYEPVEAHEHALQDELLLLEDKIFNSCFSKFTNCRFKFNYYFIMISASFTLEEREMWYTKVTENKSGNLYNSIANLTTQFQLLAKSLRPFCLMPPLSTIADSPISSPSDKENVEFAQPKVQKLSEKWSDVLKVAEGLETGNLFDYENSFGITSFSQIFINLYILEKSINWELSALKTATKCRICRRKANDEMILCDMCNRGYHIYCLKPPIKSIEDVEGDWFCYTCVPRKSSGQQTLKSEPTTTTISNEELENRLSMRKDEHINQNDVEVMSNGDSLNTCYKCKKHLYDEYSEVR